MPVSLVSVGDTAEDGVNKVFTSVGLTRPWAEVDIDTMLDGTKTMENNRTEDKGVATAVGRRFRMGCFSIG